MDKWKVSYSQGMTDRRSRDRRSERHSFFRDREVIADLGLKKRSQGDRDREIWRSRSQAIAIFFAVYICLKSNLFK